MTRYGTRRFTMAEAAAIRAAAETRTNVELAREYGCNKETIGRIVRGDTYIRRLEPRRHQRGSLDLVDGRITLAQLKVAAGEFDDCGDGELADASEFVRWLRVETQGTPEHQASAEIRRELAA